LRDAMPMEFNGPLEKPPAGLSWRVLVVGFAGAPMRLRCPIALPVSGRMRVSRKRSWRACSTKLCPLSFGRYRPSSREKWKRETPHETQKQDTDMSSNERVIVELFIMQETPKAWLCSEEKAGTATDAWLPKSMVQVLETDKNGLARIDAPAWLIVEKGLDGLVTTEAEDERP
jgi:hypothetical protein